MRFRRIPVEIEARRFTGRNGDAILRWCNSDCVFLGFEPNIADSGAHIVIETLEGEMRADPGSWIVRGVRGEFYPVKADIFAKLYERVPTYGAPADPPKVRTPKENNNDAG